MMFVKFESATCNTQYSHIYNLLTFLRCRPFRVGDLPRSVLIGTMNSDQLHSHFCLARCCVM